MDCNHSLPTGNGRVIRYATIHSWSRRGDAAPFVAPFHVNPGDRFVLLLRVSSCAQGHSVCTSPGRLKNGVGSWSG
jgi:hypothetical protein